MIAVVKIGPVTAPGMVSAAIGHDADMIGFSFVDGDAAQLSPARAATLVTAVPSGIDRVGLFRDASDETIGAVLREAPLDLLQFEGSETPERLRAVRDRFGLPLIRTLPDTGQAAAFEPVADWLAFAAATLPPGFRSRRPWMLVATLDAPEIAGAAGRSGAAALDLRLKPDHDTASAARAIRALLQAARPAME
jgi:phosphoribosylanthranilate isomerase